MPMPTCLKKNSYSFVSFDFSELINVASNFLRLSFIAMVQKGFNIFHKIVSLFYLFVFYLAIVDINSLTEGFSQKDLVVGHTKNLEFNNDSSNKGTPPLTPLIIKRLFISYDKSRK